jgi:hypothetical protein
LAPAFSAASLASAAPRCRGLRTWRLGFFFGARLGAYGAVALHAEISADGGVEVRWRADGRELYYLALDGRMMAVDARLGSTPTLGEARPLFDSGITVSVRGNNYAVSSDGQRFLLRRQVSNGRLPLNVVLNWLEAVRAPPTP